MTDPYSVLGITPSADDETIKKAYRKKCKEYHPDLHPDDPSAEEHFKEVQAAYSEIMRIKQGGGASYSAGGQRYGSSQSGYSQQYQDPFSGAGFGFGPFGFGYYSTSGSSGRQSYGSAAGDPELRAAANYIRSGPAQRQPGVFLSVVLDVFIGVQYFELVLLRRQRRILYLLIYT